MFHVKRFRVFETFNCFHKHFECKRIIKIFSFSCASLPQRASSDFKFNSCLCLSTSILISLSDASNQSWLSSYSFQRTGMETLSEGSPLTINIRKFTMWCTRSKSQAIRPEYASCGVILLDARCGALSCKSIFDRIRRWSVHPIASRIALVTRTSLRSLRRTII